MTTVGETPFVNGSVGAELVQGPPSGEHSDSRALADVAPEPPIRPAKTAAAKKIAKKAAGKKSTNKAVSGASGESKRTRRTPLFPASTFEDALELASAIYTAGSGQPVRRITLFDSLGKSPDSGPTRQLVTNSAKYRLTTGSHAAEQLALTPEGLQAVGDDITPASKARARFRLAIESVDVFKQLYESYLGSRLPTPAVLMDKARDLGVPDGDLVECIETFTVNAKFVGVLRSVSGAERLISIDAYIDDYLPPDRTSGSRALAQSSPRTTSATGREHAPDGSFETACFYITPIGDEGTERRKHSDLFMGALIEPALSEFGLNLVRADMIGEAGMITGQIIEHIVYSKLVIVDLSYHNPNVFYELALRHAVRKPIVQISRLADKLPFDIGQVRTIVVDTTDIYTLVPQIDSLRAQIAAQIRKTLDESSEVENPLSVFASYFWGELPRT